MIETRAGSTSVAGSTEGVNAPAGRIIGPPAPRVPSPPRRANKHAHHPWTRPRPL